MENKQKIDFEAKSINLVKLKLKFNEQFMKEGQEILIYDDVVKARGVIVSIVYLNK
jgi:hypothetical protein